MLINFINDDTGSKEETKLSSKVHLVWQQTTDQGKLLKVNNNKNCCEFSLLQSHDPNIFLLLVMIFKDTKTLAYKVNIQII